MTITVPVSVTGHVVTARIYNYLLPPWASLVKGMAIHSSILAWRIPWTEPGGLQSMGLQRVRHDWATELFTPRAHVLPT